MKHTHTHLHVQTHSPRHTLIHIHTESERLNQPFVTGGVFCPLGDIWQTCLETFLVVTRGDRVYGHLVIEAVVLLNVPPCAAQPFTTKHYLV